MAAHVARRREARAQARLDVIDGDEGRLLPRHARLRHVEHVGVGVDHAGDDGCLAEIDKLGVGRNVHLGGRADLGDALAIEHDHLVGQHLSTLAVEQVAGADHRHARRGGALDGAAIVAVAGRRARPAPRAALGRLLRVQADRNRRCPEQSEGHGLQHGFVLHGIPPPKFWSQARIFPGCALIQQGRAAGGHFFAGAGLDRVPWPGPANASGDVRCENAWTWRSRPGFPKFRIISPGVGRVRFNPPSRTEWRVKENPPYAGFMESIGRRVAASAAVW